MATAAPTKPTTKAEELEITKNSFSGGTAQTGSGTLRLSCLRKVDTSLLGVPRLQVTHSLKRCMTCAIHMASANAVIYNSIESLPQK
jgi:hypothetical protein